MREIDDGRIRGDDPGLMEKSLEWMQHRGAGGSFMLECSEFSRCLGQLICVRMGIAITEYIAAS